MPNPKENKQGFHIEADPKKQAVRDRDNRHYSRKSANKAQPSNADIYELLTDIMDELLHQRGN